MKLRPVLVCILSAALALVLAGGVLAAADGLQDGVSSRAAAGQARRAPAAIAVGLVLDESGLANPYNWMSYEGLLRAESELGVTGNVYTPTDDTDYANQLQQCVDDGNALCIGGAWNLGEATANLANTNPTVSFAILDGGVDTYPSNLRGMLIAYDEMGYLAGSLAGLMTASDLVGDIGGPEFVPAVSNLVEGYRNGAQCANGAARVLVEYIPSFTDPVQGAAVAQDMLSQGADVIFAAAGPTGVASIMTATQSGAWAIGVDIDMYNTVFESGAVAGADKLLSSALKYYDNAVFHTISQVVSGTFSSGELIYDLELDGIGLAPYHEADPFVDLSVRDALALIQQGIISETIAVGDPCRQYLYLPAIIKSE